MRADSKISSINNPLVKILLCTYNGSRFLAEQLDSLEMQTHQNWMVVASDDGSSDNTIEILQQYQAKWPPNKLDIRTSSKKNFCQNFLSLACDPQIRADYYAFCDQDDVWLPTKLSVALENIIPNQSTAIPYVYCGRTYYVTDKLKHCGLSPLFVFPRTFRNALVQSIAGGNTMIFNQATKSLIERAEALDVTSHDWWTYQLVTGAEGIVYYDVNPQLLYRQHENVLVGGNNSFFAKVKRLRMLFQGCYQGWNEKNIKSLKQVSHLFTKDNQEIIKIFEQARESNLIDRLRLLNICGLYRQTKWGTLSLFIAAIIGKI